ncbi:MAG: hypothetical protein U0797_21480 [Gemmataceae bacterium]
MVVNNNGAITSGSGVNVTGTAGAGSQAVVVKNGGVISTTSNAPVSVTADSVDIVSPGAINSGTGTTTIRTRTAGTLIDLGGPAVLSGNPLTLGLTADELNQITAGTLVVGDISSGTATVSAPSP